MEQGGDEIMRHLIAKDTAEILVERATTHGNYDDDAACAIALIVTLNDHMADDKLTSVQMHALHMICHKIARIVAGKADFKDHWDDIAGYAKLVADRCPVPAPEPTGCADDCVHPSHRHGRPGRRVDDCQQEKRTRVADGVYKVERLPVNGADTLGLNKPPCYCAPDQCMCDHGHVPKYVYCRKAEEASF
jgi:hypothetical protein